MRRQLVRYRGADAPYVLAVVIVAVAYVAFAEIGFSLAFAVKQVTAVWPPTGIAVAALILLGYRIWPGIFLGAFVGNALSHEPLATALGIAVGNTAGPLLAAFLLRSFDFDAALGRLRDVLALTVFAAALAMTVTATNGVLNLALAGILPWNEFGPVWLLWWAGDAMGVLLVAPLILTWASGAFRIERTALSRLGELALLGVALVIVSLGTFMRTFPLGVSVYPFVIWAALRFGQRGTTLALATVSAIAITGTRADLGPFTIGSLDQRLLVLMLFMSVLSVTGLALAALINERRLAGAQLHAAEQRFQVLAETVPQMVWTADATGWVDWYNHRWYEYTGQTEPEAAGWGWQRAYHPDDFPRMMRDWPRSIATGEPFDMESRIRQADGTFRWFLMRAEPLRDSGGAIVRWYGTHTDIDDQRRTLEHTTRVAETLQAAFVPEALPQRPDLRFDALYLTAGHEALIGGDWYDAFELPDARIVVSIGDVIGHGLNAAVNAGRIRQAIFATAFHDGDPAAILTKVNVMLLSQQSAIATALVGVIDADMRTLRYATAGHPPPILAGRAIPARPLAPGGTPLGVGDSLGAATTSVELGADDVLVFYTDGVTEFDRNIEAAEESLLNAVEQLARDGDVQHPAAMLRRAVMGTDRPVDDAVLMVVQLGPSSKTVPRQDDTDLRKTWSFHSSDAYSAHATRHELMKFIRRFDAAAEELFRAELILGEILANTVEHAPGLVNIEIDWTATHPIVTVLDTGPGLSRLVSDLPVNNLTENGRGLFLIATLALDVRAEPAVERGTKMTVILPVARGALV